MKIPRSCLRDWIKDEEKYKIVRDSYVKGTQVEKVRYVLDDEKKKKRGEYYHLEKKLFKWWEVEVKDKNGAID